MTLNGSAKLLAAAIEENLSAKSLNFAALPGGRVHSGNPTWFTSALNLPGYNGVTRAEFDPKQADDQVEAALEPFRQHKIPLTWWVGPLSQPGNLGRVLQGHGFIHNRDMTGMAASLDDLPPPETPGTACTFEAVTNLAALEAWMPVFMDVFGVSAKDAPVMLEVFECLSFAPGSEWRHYMLCDETGQVVATSSLHLGAGVAGLYNIATHPEYREIGLATAITLLTFAQAQEMGYQTGTLQTTYPNALRLYHRLGFEVYCKFGVYQRVW